MLRIDSSVNDNRVASRHLLMCFYLTSLSNVIAWRSGVHTFFYALDLGNCYLLAWRRMDGSIDNV